MQQFWFLLLIGQIFQPMFSCLDGCTVSTVQRRIDVACTYSSLSGATGFQVIVQRQNQGDKLYVNQTDQMLTSVMVEESGMYLVIVLAIEEAAGITTDSAAEYAETVMVGTQDLGKLPITMLVRIMYDVYRLFLFCGVPYKGKISATGNFVTFPEHAHSSLD